MPFPSVRFGLFAVFALLGAYAQIAQALLVRESLVVFYGNEVTLGAFFGCWLFWLAAGSWIMARGRGHAWTQRPLPWLRGGLLVLPVLLALQILLLRGVRLVLDISPSEFIPLGQMFLATLLLSMPTGLALGIAFPLACRALRSTPRADADMPGTVSGVSHLFLLDALGALLGGVLFTFVMVERLGVWHSLGWLALALALASYLLPRLSRAARWSGALVAVLGLAFAFGPLADRIEAGMEQFRFAGLQPGLELVDAVDTRYGNLALGRLGSQWSVVADGRIAESFPDPEDIQQDAAYVFSQAGTASRVLLLGGLSGDLAAELLRYPVERLDLVVQDRTAFERLRPHLPQATREALRDPRLFLHFDDGRRFVNRLAPGEHYDLALVLNADPGSAEGNRYFTQELYARLAAVLGDDGVLCTAVSSASNYLGREVRSYSGSVFRTLSSVFAHLAVAPGDRNLFCAAQGADRVTEDPALLEQRYRALPLEEHRFPALAFYSLLPADRVAFLRERLAAEGAELNTDGRPVTYYLNMLLWGRFTASTLVGWMESLRGMGPWPYLVPLVVLVSLLPLRASFEGYSRPRMRRQAALLVLAVLGLVAMAVQLALLFSYQAHLGFVFSRIALLNAAFMAGLALGAGGVGPRLALSGRPALVLAALVGVVAAALLALPSVLSALGGLDGPSQEAAFLGLCALAGLLTGVAFPLGVQQTHAETVEVLSSSGWSEAADSLGGALGALVTGGLLVPILGIRGTVEVLAMMALITLVPLGYAQLAPERVPFLRRRGFVSFPYPLLTWSMTLAVLTVYLVVLLGRAAAPGPVLHFDPAALTEVTGSQRFELREQPFPHYLGSGPHEAEPTVALATLAGAPQVRGYAGPINLLIGVDAEGRLAGIRYLHSEETPSYIEGIDAWLNGLVGSDLASAPLSLQRVDALTGATVSSRAALESINLAAGAGYAAAFARPLREVPIQPESSAWRSPSFLASLAVLLAFFPAYLSGSDRARLAYQVLVLAVFGVWLNTLVTEIDLVNLSLGQLSSPVTNPQRWLLLGFVALTTVAFGPVWCGYVCPFGALQELVSRLGRRLRLRAYVERPLEQRLRLLKYVLLAALLLGVWISGDPGWASFNPMQHFFSGSLSGWMALVAGISLVGSLFYYRFWCRYFCPFGAFLALGNKLSLLGRLGPARRLEQCDLGVRDEFDVDCIRCSRCVHGRDFGRREADG